MKEDEVIVKVEEGKLTIRALRPKVVDVDPSLIEKLLREECELEKRENEEALHG